MNEEPQTYSIALRLRRVTFEDAYVSVLVTDAIMQKKEDGSFGLDVDAFIAEAMRMGSDPRVEWKIESTEIEPHPVQGPKPDDRSYFDSYYANKKIE